MNKGDSLKYLIIWKDSNNNDKFEIVSKGVLEWRIKGYYRNKLKIYELGKEIEWSVRLRIDYE